MLCAVGLSFAGPADAGVPVAEATEQQTADARDAYVEAKEAYDAGDLETALTRFRASYDIVASPNSHLMVAKCLMALGRQAEAYREVKLALPEAEAAASFDDKYLRTAEDAKKHLETLRAAVGFVTIRIAGDVGGDVTVNGVSVATLTEPVVVDPGEIEVVLEGAQGRITRRVTVGGGGTALVELGADPAVDDPADPVVAAPEEPDDDDGLDTPVIIGFVAAGIGVTGMALFGVFGALTSSQFSDLETACAGGVCPEGTQEDIDAGQTFQIVANTSLIVGVTGLIAGAALIAIPLAGGDDDDTTALVVGPGQLGIRGAF